MEKEDFKIAFQVRDYNTGLIKHDKSYVDWQVHIYEG